MVGTIKKTAFVALAFLACACATTTKNLASRECTAKESFRLGERDFRGGNPLNARFAKACTPATRGSALRNYRAGYAHRSKPSMPLARIAPATWVCEIEAASKVFTGVGSSEGEAENSAKDTCGTHFSSSSCTHTECTKEL